MTVHIPAIAKEFSAEEIIAAIRAAQADGIRYPEFIKRAEAAGILGYPAFLAGKRATYVGRMGHVQRFPPLNPETLLSRVYNSLPRKSDLYTMGLHAGRFISGVRK